MKKKMNLDNFKEKTMQYTKLFKIPNSIKILEFCKKHKKILIGILVVVFLLVGYYIGSPKDNKQQVINKLEVGLENGNVRTLNNIVRIEGKSASGNELKPLAKYFQNRSDKVQEFVGLVENGEVSKIMTLKKEEGFFKDRYVVDLKTFDLMVNSNLKNTKITLDGEEIQQGKVVKNLVPGEYTLEGTVDSNYGMIKETGEISVLKNTNINLDLRGDSVTVNSEYADAKVLVNGVDSGKTVKQFKNVGPMPMDGSVTLSIEKKFPWGIAKGEPVVLKDNSEVNLTLNMANDTLWKEVDGTLNGFYKSVFSALNSGDKNQIDCSTDEAKNKIYATLEEKYFFLKNNYKLESLSIDKEKSNFVDKNGVYEGTVVCDINYTVSKEVFGISGFSSSKENKKFFAKVIYKNNKWIVNDVENFSL